ncbi:MAG: LytTR family DNA-binding domain-containing protein [Flavobacteriales bacterium]|nr:LytTR family DNA-binding domain-containing protein [Flavobacteriales bacterium]
MSEQITAIVVDDEESARSILANLLLRFCPVVRLVGSYANVEDAVAGIKELRPQLVFLDIEMPNYSGFEIVNFFEKVDFEMVFITAYDKYAIRAFEVSAVDYLLKPIDIDRLNEAVERVQQRVGQTSAFNRELLSESLQNKEVARISVADKGYQTVVNTCDIVAIEASESYSTIRTLGAKPLLVSKNLKHFETVLADNRNFFRSHKSWMVNLDMLEKYNRSTGDIVLRDSVTAKLSKYRKEEFEELLRLR